MQGEQGGHLKASWQSNRLGLGSAGGVRGSLEGKLAE